MEGTVKASNLVRVIQNASGLNQRALSVEMGHGKRYVERLIFKGSTQKITTLLELCEASGCELLLRTKDGEVLRIVND